MRPHEGDRDVERRLAPDAVDDRKHPEFRRRIEPVAAFHLHRGRSGSEGPHRVRARDGEEFVIGRASHGAHRGEDAAPLFQDLKVRHAGQTKGKLAFPRLREARVRVRVHEAGDAAAPPAVNLHVDAEFPRAGQDVPLRPGGDD